LSFIARHAAVEVERAADLQPVLGLAHRVRVDGADDAGRGTLVVPVHRQVPTACLPPRDRLPERTRHVWSFCRSTV
jgi:hypothetical protein